jgi:hypothetical protein
LPGARCGRSFYYYHLTLSHFFLAAGDQDTLMAAQFPGDVSDQIDDAPAEPSVLDARERLGQGQAVGGGEESRIRELLREGVGIVRIGKTVGCGTGVVQRVKSLLTEQAR